MGGTAGATGLGGAAGTGGGTCLPDLVVPWSVVQNVLGDPLITCAQAGADHTELDVNGVTFAQSCPANANGGEFVIPLADRGTYTLDAFLVTPNGSALSEAHPPTISVGCDGLRTPTIILPVNL